MTTQPRKLPNPEKVKSTVEQLRASNRQLEMATLALDELIAKVDADLRIQRKLRLQSHHQI